MADILVSKEGYNTLVDKIAYLKTVRRMEVSDKIASAKIYGDLSENAEYQSAKEEQTNLEIEISELEDKLANVVIVEKVDNKNIVNLGSKVKVFDISFNEEVEYVITGAMESSPLENKVSVESPIGKALYGKKKGDEVEAITPAGPIKMKILAIKN